MSKNNKPQGPASTATQFQGTTDRVQGAQTAGPDGSAPVQPIAPEGADAELAARTFEPQPEPTDAEFEAAQAPPLPTGEVLDAEVGVPQTTTAVSLRTPPTNIKIVVRSLRDENVRVDKTVYALKRNTDMRVFWTHAYHLQRMGLIGTTDPQTLAYQEWQRMTRGSLVTVK